MGRFGKRKFILKVTTVKVFFVFVFGVEIYLSLKSGCTVVEFRKDDQIYLI